MLTYLVSIYIYLVLQKNIGKKSSTLDLIIQSWQNVKQLQCLHRGSMQTTSLQLIVKLKHRDLNKNKMKKITIYKKYNINPYLVFFMLS